MGLSHIIFPDMYRAYYKTSRGELCPITLQNQIESQKQILNELTTVLPFTKYGIENNLIKDISGFEMLQSLPLVNYEDIYPYIQRVWNGEDNILWYGKTKWFAKSSGTTNAKSKYIPVTQESIDQNHFLGGRDMLYFYFKRNPKSQIGFDSVLTISGSIQDINEVAQTHAGDISTVLDLNSPWWAQLSKVLPQEILKIASWQERLPKVIDFVKNSDIKAFTGTVTWVQIIINEVIKNLGVKDAINVWPNLEVFFHGAVSIKPYLEEFKRLIPKSDFYFVEVYNASEGFFAFQDTDNRDDGMLLLAGHGIYYEFIDLKNKTIHTIDDLELNNSYEIVISTVSGLWRYRIGDVILVSSIDPVRIKVIGRTQAMLNAYGEELMVGNVDEAIRLINQEGQYSVKEYTGCPVYKNENINGAHEWVIEFENLPSDIEHFKKVFDEKLKSLNSDYEAKRKGDIVLSTPIIHPVLIGTFYKWMESRNKIGGQNKIPRLSDNRQYLEEIKNICGIIK